MNLIRIPIAAALLAVTAAAALSPAAADVARADEAARTDGAPPMPPGPRGWDGPRRPHRGPAAMFRQLGLTDAQQASIKSILEQNRPALRSLHEQTGANSMKLWNTPPNDPNYAMVVADVSQANAAILTQEITLQANLRAQLFGVLTPAQQTQLAALQAQRRARMAEHGHPGFPPPAP